MKTAEDYLTKTDSAVRHLFSATQTYLDTLKLGLQPTFMSGLLPGPELEAQYAAWRIENAEALEKAKDARQTFREERFALDTLCGAILQIAEKGLEIYSENKDIPSSWKDRIPKTLTKFAVGREVRGVPLGLIVYAARNQHTHFNDRELRAASAGVFHNLAAVRGLDSPARDPAFDLENPALTSYAANITALIGWRDAEQYRKDMRGMLGVAP
jgi:hypothetical protein